MSLFLSRLWIRQGGDKPGSSLTTPCEIANQYCKLTVKNGFIARRFGNIFKSLVFLKKTILGTTPEFAKFVLSNSELFHSVYPGNVAHLLPSSFLFLNGPPHAAIRKVVSRFTVPGYTKKMVGHLEGIVLESLAMWEQRGDVLGFDVATQVSFF
jgi:cytochrome P450